MANSTQQKLIVSDGQYEISAKLSYLLGVSMNNIQKVPSRSEHCKPLEQNRHAKIVRNLCILRTDIMRSYQTLCEQMRLYRVGISGQPAAITGAAVKQLEKERILWNKKGSILPEHHIIEINRLILDRINNCKSLFPLWVDWNHIRNLFIMPDGLTKAGVKEALNVFRKNLPLYPYQVYINWSPKEVGNILCDDKTIVSVMYEQDDETFADKSKVSDVGSFVKDGIFRFIGESNKLVIAVDCENSDPYKLCAALRGLSVPLTQKISKIVLFDDVNTGPLWRVLEDYTSIPVEYILVERVTKFKSLVDTTLTATVSKEHYMNGVDSFILVSSDSDYWGMISSLTSARFLLMVERDNCGELMKQTLREAGIFFCYLDDFYTGSTVDIKYGVVMKQIRQELETVLTLNLNTLLNTAIQTTRADMTDAEQRQFYDKFLRRAKLEVDAEGNCKIAI